MAQNRIKKKNKKLLSQQSTQTKSKKTIASKKAEAVTNSTTENTAPIAKKQPQNKIQKIASKLSAAKPAMSKISKYTSKVPTLLWFVLIVILSAVMLNSSNVDGKGMYSNSNQIELQYDHFPSQEEVNSLIELAGINPESIEVVGATTVRITTRSSIEQVQTLLEATVDNEGILSSSGYVLYPANTVLSYFPGFILTVIALIIGSILVALVFTQGRSFGDKLRSAVFFNSIFLTGIIAFAAIGLILNRIGLISYSYASFNSFIALAVIGLLALTFVFSRNSTREYLLSKLKLSN